MTANSFTGKHHVGAEVVTEVRVACRDGLESRVMNAANLLADKAGLQEDVKAAEALASDSDEFAIWKLVSFLYTTTHTHTATSHPHDDDVPHTTTTTSTRRR